MGFPVVTNFSLISNLNLLWHKLGLFLLLSPLSITQSSHKSRYLPPKNNREEEEEKPKVVFLLKNVIFRHRSLCIIN